MSGFLATIVKRRSTTALRALTLVGLAASLAGCYSTQRVTEVPYPEDYHQRHPITLKEREQTVEVFVGRNRGGLSPSQRADVLAFAQQWRHESTSGIIVDVPHSKSIDRASAESLREVQSIFAASGVPRNAIYMRPYKTPDPTLASIKLNFAKLSADAGPCGLWPHDLGVSLDQTYTENRPYWNLGCASQRNLAAMVVNPADLVQPRGETPAYAPRRSVALEKYRKGDNPSATYGPEFDKAKVSDIGK
ncbi:MAG TPA: CpaD family pilus assembly protein [Pseudolabrys sp.]|nr:CpaD family pilus assembly protein [Pseudolabrys sp.]